MLSGGIGVRIPRKLNVVAWNLESWNLDVVVFQPWNLDVAVFWPWNLDAVAFWSWNLGVVCMCLHCLVFVFTKSIMPHN